MEFLGETQSVCPVCLIRIPARKLKRGDTVYMEKVCPEHGPFQTVLWHGLPDYKEWGARLTDPLIFKHGSETDRGCPYNCGICSEHRQSTCCVLLEITSRCDPRCPVCFASSGGEAFSEPSHDEIGRWFDMLMEGGGPYNIQLSGGEPTSRDDVPQIIRLGREKGFVFFQLNTNGLRLARQPDYALELKEAGLDCVFLQFDGLRDETCMALRGRRLLELKLEAVENCSRAGLGIVLVPTLAPAVNRDEIGPVLRFALEHMPHVRGVHFQPLAYFGRYPAGLSGRLTIPELLREIERQTGGQMKTDDFQPGAAENPYCSFNGSFLLQPDGTLKPLKKREGSCCSGNSGSARRFVAKHWSAAEKTDIHRDEEPWSLDAFLDRMRQYTLAVSGMAFQDAWNLDLERLQSCHIHVAGSDRRLVPFCAYNLTGTDGRGLIGGASCENIASGRLDKGKARRLVPGRVAASESEPDAQAGEK